MLGLKHWREICVCSVLKRNVRIGGCVLHYVILQANGKKKQLSVQIGERFYSSVDHFTVVTILHTVLVVYF